MKINLFSFELTGRDISGKLMSIKHFVYKSFYKKLTAAALLSSVSLQISTVLPRITL